MGQTIRSFALIPYLPWVLAFSAVLICSYLPILMSEQVIDDWVAEDQILESLSSLYLFVTAGAFAAALFRSKTRFNIKDPVWLRRMFFLGFALLFFVAGGEEISWGQRIFRIEIPEALEERNIQKELNLHNLDIFQGEDAIIPITTGRLGALFALTFGALIPLACTLVKPVGQWLALRFPVLPASFSLLFLGNYALQKLLVRLLPAIPQLYHHPTMPVSEGVYEIREHGYAFALMVSVIFYVFFELKNPPRIRSPYKIPVEGINLSVDQENSHENQRARS